MHLLIVPIIVTLVTFLAVYAWGGVEALLLTMALAALEISLSFDNAVVNAKVLATMSPQWQRRFLTWGIPVAVFGVRFVLPIIIVALAVWQSPLLIAQLAFYDPDQYALLLGSADSVIHAFGGSFLLMVALKYFFDEKKRIHWFEQLERRLVRWGEITAIETLIALVLIIAVAMIAVEPAATLVAGVTGIALHLILERVTRGLMRDVRSAAAGGFALFFYLNVLDSAFSLDGVVGAFALTTQILVILAGLGIGAYFVRTFTVILTRHQTLQRYMYLEHGAHWAIFSLSLCLFAALFTHVPEVIPGAVGLLFATLSFISSQRVNRLS